MWYMRLHFCFLIVLSLAGCFEGGDTGSEGFPKQCPARTDSAAVAPGAATQYGTPADFVERAEGEWSVPMRYWNGAPGGELASLTTTASIELTADVSTSRVVSHEQPGDPESTCAQSLEIDAVLRLETEDGSFQEQVPGLISIVNGSEQFQGTVLLADKGGLYDVGAETEPVGFTVTAFLREDSDGAPAGQRGPYKWEGLIFLKYKAADGESSRMIAEW